ncbi:MAG: L-fuculokinase [Bacteroidales bacterium]|nr:L-fuculokinase [Bacteroidales bacterium]
MKHRIILVLDCGATNVRTIAVSEKGEILASESLTNNTQPDPENRNYRIWDVNEIWNKFRTTTGKVLEKIESENIAGITVTAFGVDGAPFNKSGKMLYPVISWQCQRTELIMQNIEKYMPQEHLFSINGLQPFIFNTINKLIWLKENRPAIFDQMDYFIFIPSIFLYFLTGEMVTDSSMAGTSMLTDLRKRSFSQEILNSIGISDNNFPRMVEPGDVIGKVTHQASIETGIPAGIPVVAAGHDTQFAIFGSGAAENAPVLSSGTWEILMVRTSNIDTSGKVLQSGVSTEFDPLPGLYNMGVQWIASGALEWLKKMFFAKEIDKEDIYEIMINEARKVKVGSNGIRIDASFYPAPGGADSGFIRNLTMETSRGDIYRAALESLSCKTRERLGQLQKTGKFKADSLICVGGGSKNKLWNQIRADILGIPVKLIDQKETTVLGAALFAMSGVNIFSSPDEARNAIDYTGDIYEPSLDSMSYTGIYEQYLELRKSH